MTGSEQETGKAKRQRRPLGIGELLSVGLFAWATLMMMADFVAIAAARPLHNLPSIAPWYLSGLPLIGVSFVVVSWLAFRRWLSGWVPLVAYMVFMGVSTSLDWHGMMAKRVETIELTKPMGNEEIVMLESAIGERVYVRGSIGESEKLLIRRDPQVHERAVRWLAEHGQ